MPFAEINGLNFHYEVHGSGPPFSALFASWLPDILERQDEPTFTPAYLCTGS